ncbi:MAG: hypothetical protein Q8R48_03260 [Candidatus Omnitrophota bacterium]|nr:hypothetical protein [Candidatus Omnitrophota bacterium]
MSNQKAVALILVIIIIAVVAVVVLGIASFISSGLALNIARSYTERAIFGAQAGVYAAIRDYIATTPRYWVKARNTNVLGNVYYSIGRDANFLLIDADNPQITNNIIQRIPLSNINQTQAITADKMKVEWYNFPANTRLNRITLGGSQRWTGSAISGQTPPLTLSPAFRLNARQTITGTMANSWRFTNNIPKNAIIIVTFYYSTPSGDGSSRTVYLYNNGRSGNYEFSITATGEAREKVRWKRTIEATYDAGVNRITSWQETQNHI